MSSVNPPSKRRRGRASFLKSETGATALEFALIATPFFALLLGIIELGLIFMASITLENAISKASRQIRTGEVKAPAAADQVPAALEAFRKTVCVEMAWMQASCNANLTLHVKTFTNFNDISLSSPVQNGAFNPGAAVFQTGGPSSIVLVRAYYQWPLIAPLMNQGLVKTPGKTLIMATTTFRNEPFPAS